MNSYYKAIDKIKEYIQTNGISNTVSFGDDSKLDLNKTTIFPIAHFDVTSAEISDNSVIFTIYILFVGLIDQDWEEESEDEFYSGNNEQDVMNEQLFCLVGLVDNLKRGVLFKEGIKLYSAPNAQPINAFDDSQAAGWACELRVEVAKNFSIC